MPVPREFTQEYIKEHTGRRELYQNLLKSGEPYRSLNKHNVHTSAREGYSHNPFTKDGKLRPELARPESPGLDLQDEGLYYNTAGAAAAYWKDADLPKPTKDIVQLREDLLEWGYCMIHEGLSAEQLARMQKRTSDQAEGERLAGVASWTGRAGGNQLIHAILNKDTPDGQFAKCMCHDPEGVQAGPVIEKLIGEAIGEDFTGSSFLGIIANRHDMPQGLHQDQGVMHMGGVQEAPWSINTMYVLDDFCAENGGTLVVPRSHRSISEVGAGNPVRAPFPPAINLCCPAGTIVLFEGRLLHGTGVNRTDKPRRMYVANSLKPFFRSQELWPISLRPEVLAKASPKLLHRLGFRPTGIGGIEGDWHPEHVNALRSWREAVDVGGYARIGVLSPESTEEELTRNYTWRGTAAGRALGRRQPFAIPAVREKYGLPESKL